MNRPVFVQARCCLWIVHVSRHGYPTAKQKVQNPVQPSSTINGVNSCTSRFNGRIIFFLLKIFNAEKRERYTYTCVCVDIGPGVDIVDAHRRRCRLLRATGRRAVPISRVRREKRVAGSACPDRSCIRME